MERFDVVIVGARCAGSPLAAMLARRGLRVCVLDRSRFPSETLSTHVIQPCGAAILGRLGVLDAVSELGAVPLGRFTVVIEDARIDARVDVEAFGAPGLCVRRVTLDHLLVEAAASAGAEVRTGTSVTTLLWEDGRVAGVETERGPLHAPLVVGADGRRSTVAALVGTAEYHVAPPGRLFAWAYFEGVAEAEGHLRLGRLGELAFLASPTDSGLYMAAVAPSLGSKDAFLADREGSFMAALGAWPELADLLGGASRIGPIRVMANWHGYFREAVGPGWALLGDAGHFKDPTPAQGIADALRQAEHLADAVEAGLGGAVSIDDELGRWWRWRDQDAYEMHWFATDLGAAGASPPLATQLIRDIADDDQATEKLMRVLNHDIRPSQLFRPRRLGKAAARVARHRPDQIPTMLKEIASAVRNQVRRARQRRNRRDRFVRMTVQPTASPSRLGEPDATGAPPRPARDVPGPRLPRPLQSWLGVMRPVEARLAMRKRYGTVFRSNDAIAGEVFHIADSELVEQMFKWKPAEYNVGEPRQIMEPVTGPSSILLLDAEPHMRMRKLMLPPFHGEAIAHYAELIEQITNREIGNWRPGDTIRTRTVAQAITMEVIIRTVFGITDADRITALKRLLPRLSSINPLLAIEAVRKDLGPRSPWGRFIRDRGRVDKMLYEEIEHRRQDPGRDTRNDILTLLLSARDSDGNPLTDRELRDELITILLAGHETTATSIGWAFERLLRTPAALERLTDEVRAGESSDYIDAVIKETLRVRPVVTEVFRAPTEHVELGGYLFEPGTQLAASIFLVQCDPRLYPPDPHVFRPERFLEGAPEPYTWIPFGGGVRRCLGAAFAQLEMKIVISTMVARARLRATRARSEKARFRGATVLPSRGGEAIVESV